MRTVLALVAALALASTTSGCGGARDEADDGRLDVVAAFFPLAEAARAVGGSDIHVVDLTPPGVEPHDLEISSKTVDAIDSADVVLVMGGRFQPAVEEVAAHADGDVVRVFDALHADGRDPHVWLDPTVFSTIVGVVGRALHAPPARVAAYQRRLAALDHRYETTLATCTQKVLVGSHEAYGYLARRYGLRDESITGLVPEEEPDPSKLDELVRLVQREHITTVFYEPLLPKRAAETIAREADVRVAPLDPLESDPGRSYVDAMDGNLEVLARGLGCAPPR
jgi:zinc transport system substrate-binding protein